MFSSKEGAADTDPRGSSAFTVVFGSRVSIVPRAPFLTASTSAAAVIDDDDDDDVVGGVVSVVAVVIVVIGGSVFRADTNAIAALGGGETKATVTAARLDRKSVVQR